MSEAVEPIERREYVTAALMAGDAVQFDVPGHFVYAAECHADVASVFGDVA